jgi:hypothetical protein
MFSIFRRRHREPLDLRGLAAGPVEGLRRAGDRPFLLDVPVESIRAVGFAGADAWNPFVLTLREYAAGRCGQFKGSLLEDFYRCWQPFAAGEDAMRQMPWKAGARDARNTSEGRLAREGFVEAARELGVSPGEIRGHIKGGPVTEAFGEITFRRIARLHDSVRDTGYRPESSPGGHLRGQCFVRNGDFCVVVGSGKHRVCALLALGWEKIPVRFGAPKLPVVTRREEVDSWPQVREGLYTRDEALSEFDALFARSHPSGWRPPSA